MRKTLCRSLVGLLSLAFVAGPVCRAEEADPASLLQTLPGFKVETVMTADRQKEGSWISMTTDDKGRLLIAGQRNEPVTRLTLKDGKVAKEELLKLPLSECMGMLYAFGSLYVDGYDGHRYGLFRLRDTKGNDQYDSVEFLREWPHGTGDHGAHAILLSPDKKKLFIVCGNFVQVPDDLVPTSPHRNYADDLPLPRAEDGNGFGAGKKPPGGFIVSLDPDGKNPSLFAAGLRNTYDIAFNPDGELFLFDSDMEWDWGMPWYRPIRIIHAVSGGDYGFREGTAKWPDYYADSLPGINSIGIGSPTGVVFGTGAKFPAEYQKAFYALDWTYGRLIAVHLTPDGASYSGKWENFVAPKSLEATSGKTPLNLTDVVIGTDGAMYFTIGGRNTLSRLYRVTYAGTDSTAPVDTHDAGKDARDLRHKLEAFHGHKDPGAVAFAWPYLDSPDRFLRYAARIAVEAQPVSEWKQKALNETRPQAGLTALLALARYGSREDQPAIFKSLEHFPFSSLSPELQLEKLRVAEVSISRQGKPRTSVAAPLVGELDPQYPAKTFPLNRELCQVLLALEAPDAVAKSVKLLNTAPTQEEQIAYILYLRTIKTGWTPELRRSYFAWWTHDHSLDRHPAQVLEWFKEAGRPYDNGASFNNFIMHLHDDAEATLTPDERKSLADVLAGYMPKSGGKRPAKILNGLKFVKDWKMADLESSLDKVGHGRNFEMGREVFATAQCIACHRFGNEGGAVGPDLTAISSRFARRDILDSILEPSKVVSEQYANTIVRFKEGGGVVGRIVQETPDKLVVQPSLLSPEKIEVKRSDVKDVELSKVSPMPEGLVNTFTKNQILDLLAYLESGGRSDNPDFRK